MAKNGEVQEQIKEKKECCSARNVLWYLVFFGFAVNYMIRINLNIAIVAMIQPKARDNLSLSSECIASDASIIMRQSSNNFSNSVILSPTAPTVFHSLNYTPASFADPSNLTTLEPKPFTSPPSQPPPTKHPLRNTTFRDKHHSPFTNVGPGIRDNSKFDWNEKVQGHVLGSFFWLHWTTQIPGGLLAGKYGTKLVFGLSNFAGVVFCFAIPFFAKLGSTHLMVLRLVQGILCGFAWPSMHDMTAKWIPPNERSKFVTAYLGSSVGAAMTYPICGFIIDRWGWEYVFYACSAFGTSWFIAWWALVHDSPSEHPRISDNEKEYILTSLGKSVAKDKAPVPWSDIIRDKTVWVNVLAQWGGLWGLFTLMTHAPTYFKFIHGWNIKATGLFSGMPHLLRMVWAYIFSQIGDFLLRTNKMTRTNVRKLATVICCMGQGIFMMCLAYSGCDATVAIVFLTLAVAVHGSVSTGPLASVVDVSPNYAGVILGMMNTAAAFVGFFTPAVVGYLTFQNQTTPQWQKVFWIASGWLFISGIMYVIFAKSELQPWNSPEKAKEHPEEELMVIKTEKSSKSDV